jgi:hypothetical protein
MVIGGDEFSGKPGDWADVKTEIVSEIETAGYSYITKMRAYLFSAAGSGDHGHIEDGDLEKFQEANVADAATLNRQSRASTPKSRGIQATLQWLATAWHGLLKMYQDENKPLEALIDRLQAEQHLEMMRLMAAHPQEGTAWEDVYKKCVARQAL